MDTISNNAALEFTNVLSFRGKVTQQRVSQISKEMEQLIDSNQATRIGPSISTTFKIENDVFPPLFDLQLMIPMDRYIDVAEPFFVIPRLYLKNAVKIRHTGDIYSLQGAMFNLSSYIKKNHLEPITPAYNVVIQENPNDMIVEIYIGIKNL